MFRAGLNKDLRKREQRRAQKAKVREFNKNNIGFLRREIKVYEKYNRKLTIEEKVSWLRDWRSDPRVEWIKASREKFLRVRSSYPCIKDFEEFGPEAEGIDPMTDEEWNNFAAYVGLIDEDVDGEPFYYEFV